jgi:selenocysteine lyase/cysteine desulfurase
VKLVTVDETLWAELPDRQEAGSPNVIGAVALGVACDTLASVGMDRIAAEEGELLSHARAVLGAIPDFEHYRVWPAEHPRVGLLTFNMRGVPYDLLAAVLSAEYGIGIRHGCFCAHPLMMRLLRVDDAETHRLIDETKAGHHERFPGAARMSLGLASTKADVQLLADALRAIAADGPRWTYAVDGETDQYEPSPDPRPLPPLAVRMVEHPHGHGESA